MSFQVVAVTDDDGALRAPDWLARAEAVHRQLRPQLPPDYAGRLAEIFAGGARMAVAIDGDGVVAVALWRIIENTCDRRKLYVDDLVSDDARRSQGAGSTLLGWLEAKAASLGCDVLSFDSGVHRLRAHRFYFREGMHIASFCFRKALEK